MFEKYLVIFDMDGVLADTSQIHFESWVKMANEMGVKLTRKFFEGTFGQQSVPITRKLFGDKVDQAEIVKRANLKELYYREMVRDKLEPLPGVIELIRTLRENNFKLAVGSSGPPENVELLLTSLKIKEFFDIIITAADVKIGKPAPDVFLIVAKRLNLNPECCIVIEDAPVGIKAAKRAGMVTIALTTTHIKDELSDADLILKDLSYIELNDIIKLLKLKMD